MLGTVGNMDSTVVGGVDKKIYWKKYREKIPGTGTGVLRCMHAGGVGGGMRRDHRVSVLLLEPVRKGVG